MSVEEVSEQLVDEAFAGLTARGLVIVNEGYNQEDGWGYRHFLLRRPE